MKNISLDIYTYMKTCTLCKQTKPLEEFGISKSTKDGLNYRCKECNRERERAQYGTPKYNARKRKDRARHNDRNRKYIHSVLQKSECVDCGEKRWQVLEFDHVRRTKINSIGNMIQQGVSIAVLQAEIDKCEIRCANCHRLKTANEFGWEKAINPAKNDSGPV